MADAHDVTDLSSKGMHVALTIGYKDNKDVVCGFLSPNELAALREKAGRTEIITIEDVDFRTTTDETTTQVTGYWLTFLP